MNQDSDKDLKPCAMIMLITENVQLHKLNTKCQETLSKYKICPEGPECPELD